MTSDTFPPRGARKSLAIAAHFVRRELRNRYLGSISGGLWALLQPLMQLVIYGFVWTYVFKMARPEDVPIVPFLALGVWPWNAFSEAVMRSATAIQDNAGLIGKVAFPHGVLVFAASSASFLLHGVGFVVVVVAVELLGVPLRLAHLPFALLAFALLFVLALGFGYLFAAVQVFVRDLSQVLGQLLPLMMFTAPVLYSRDFLPERFRHWLDWNPFTFYPEYLRAELLGTGTVGAAAQLAALALAVAVCVLGYSVFHRLDPRFEDFL
ncbi:MAG: ABC transporter permease [Rudaea sp.]|uniref:ABC transporter permease n=1 Tax=Rudaea sp. TaxID=2136325 RepID=UPI0039E4108C